MVRGDLLLFAHRISMLFVTRGTVEAGAIKTCKDDEGRVSLESRR